MEASAALAMEEKPMDGGDEIRQLLRDIRDAQREHLAEYRRVTERSLELQQRAVARQEQIRDRKSTRLNSSHIQKSRMPSSA